MFLNTEEKHVAETTIINSLWIEGNFLYIFFSSTIYTFFHLDLHFLSSR